MIIQELSTNEATLILMRDEYAAWTYHGAKALVEYLEELSDETGENLQLDPVALRCEFTEYLNFERIKDDYSDIETIDDLYDRTIVIELEVGFIIQQF